MQMLQSKKWRVKHEMMRRWLQRRATAAALSSAAFISTGLLKIDKLPVSISGVYFLDNTVVLVLLALFKAAKIEFLF